MQISCPHCGCRDLSEFTYQGDATRTYPSLDCTDEKAWMAYVYGRTNPAGLHREYWHHAGGCRAHLLVTRDTRDHRIESVALANGSKA